VNYGNIPIFSPFRFYIPPEARWLFVVALAVFIIAIHIHAANRD
jgi:hypothetical protein